METSHDNDQKRNIYDQSSAASKSILDFLCRKYNNNSFVHRCTISTTKTNGLQHCCSHGRASLYQPWRLWKNFRQVWTISLVRKRLQLLGCKIQSFQKRRQLRFSNSPKFYKVVEPNLNLLLRKRNQLVIAAGIFDREQVLFSIQIPSRSKKRINNSNWLTGLLMLWIPNSENIKVNVTIGCNTGWKIQWIHALRSENFSMKNEEKNFRKMFLWTTNLMILYILSL